jgi:hypothetical protein
VVVAVVEHHVEDHPLESPALLAHAVGAQLGGPQKVDAVERAGGAEVGSGEGGQALLVNALANLPIEAARCKPQPL